MFRFFRVHLEAASSWDSLFRVLVHFLFVWAWIQVFWICLSFILLEEVTQGRDELNWVSGVFTCRIGWWLVVTSVPDIFSLGEFVDW